MSYATVRAQIASFLGAPAITGVLKVYEAMPWYIDGSNWDLAANLGSGSVVYVHLAQTSETRQSLPAVQGFVEVDYQVAIVVLYQYLIPSNGTSIVSEDAWVAPLDVTLQAIKDRVHSDPSLGNANLIKVSAQEQRTLRTTAALPRRTSGKVLMFHTIEFETTEVIVA